MDLLPELPPGTHWSQQAIAYLVFHLTRALVPFLQQNSFLYWPYSLATLALALVLGRKAFFNRQLWWHPSARMDYVIYLVNALIWPLIAVVFLVNESAVLALANRWLGANTASAEPGVMLRLFFTLAIFVAYDLGRFMAHGLLHHVDALWEIHKVHHSALVLTPLTSYRAHPFELLLMAALPAILTGLTTYAFNAAFGLGITVYVLLGLHVLLTVTSFFDNLRHSPVWLTYGERVGRWVVSPAHHQLHHSCEPRHLGCNLGFSLALWDRMAGTLVVPRNEPETFRMGLSTDPREANPHRGLWSVYVAPLLAAAQRLGAAGSRLLGRGG